MDGVILHLSDVLSPMSQMISPSLAHLFHVVSFAVGKIIAYQFGSLHAEWLEAVALDCQPVGEWEVHLVGIQRDAMALFTWCKVFGSWIAAELDFRAVVERVVSFFWESEFLLFLQVVQRLQRRDEQLVSVDG